MSIKVGDKYIIEIGTIAELPDGKKKYFIKPFESLVFDKIGLAQLEPVEKAWENELEKAKLFAYKNGYNNALEDVNHAIDVLKGMTVAECAEWFEDHVGVDDVVCTFTIQRIIESTRAYEEKKKAEEESIKVGDEVYLLDKNHPIVVTSVVGDTIVCLAESGKYSVIDTSVQRKHLTKTGRHFDEVEQLLHKLGDENND